MRRLTERTITTPDGRALRVVEAGDPTGPAILAHHGTPCSARLPPAAVRDAQARGARLIGWDRPGYGGSDRRPGRSVADVAADAVAVADALEVERFVSWGISGGGPHVLATGALAGDRCAAVASLAGVAPYGAEGLDWMAGMGEDNVEEFGAALEGEAALRTYLEGERAGLLSTSAEDLAAAMRTLLSPPDVAVLTGEFAAFMHAWMTEGLQPGADGWLDDDLAFVTGWGFDLADVRVPILLWQGEQDLMVPAGHGRWLAGRLPGAQAHVDAAEGHLTLLQTRIADVHGWLVDHL